jgi:hypothetical protein
MQYDMEIMTPEALKGIEAKADEADFQIDNESIQIDPVDLTDKYLTYVSSPGLRRLYTLYEELILAILFQRQYQ